MNNYLWWSGVVLNMALFGTAIVLIWFIFVYPALQAISLATVCIKALGDERKTSMLKIHWWAQKELFLGKNFETIRTNRFQWSNIGKWQICKMED